MYSEFELIQHIKQLFPTSEGVTVGIGDDGAVLDPGRFDLVTTDTMVEGVHFHRSWSSPQDIGWKAIASNLSDIAAMGGGPGVILLNLVLPRGVDRHEVDGLLEGMKLAMEALIPQSFQVSLAGGDLTSTKGPMMVSVTLLGESSPAGPVLRQGAVPGDRIIMLGCLGMSAAGLWLLERDEHLTEPLEDYATTLLGYHRRPTPRIYEGAILGLYGVPSAMIDVSDGFLQDLGHIITASHVGAFIETHGMPRHAAMTEFGQRHGYGREALLELMLTGGEDYELLFTVPPARMPKLWELARRYDWDVYDIGEVRSPEEGLRLMGSDGQPMELPDVAGFTHDFSAQGGERDE